MADSVLVPCAGAFAAGTAGYWLYFHRYETHLHGLTYLNTFLTTYVGGILALTKGYGWALSAAAALTTSVAVSFLLGTFGNLLLWRLFLNPLNRFPGPYAARISNFWLSSKLGKSDGYYFIENLHKKYGKFVRIGSNDLSIIDADAVDIAYGNKTRVTKSIWYDNDYPLTSMHTSRDKALHDRRRRVWAPAFSDKALRDYESEIQKFNDKLVAKFSEHAAQSKPVNVTKWFNLFSFDAMGLLAFGRQYGMIERGEKPHELEMLDEGMQPLAYRLPSWFFRLLTSVPGLSAGYQKFVNFCIGELTWRVQNANSTEKRGRETDIMSWLLKAYTDVPHPEKDSMLQADARLIIVAGSDTTAATFTFLFYHLAQHPRIVAALREEIQSLIKDSPTAWSDKEIRNAPLLNGCINESLRLHPPVPSGLNRLTPPEGITVGETYVPGNVTFIMPLYTMGRSRDIYVDPDAFLPTRWTTETHKVLHPGAFVPFSAGPMGCIGRNLALMELRTLTAKLVLKFDFEFAPGEDGRRIREETKDHFTVDVGDLELRLRERK